MELTPSQWIIIPLLILTNLVVTVSLLGLFLGPVIATAYNTLRARRQGREA